MSRAAGQRCSSDPRRLGSGSGCDRGCTARPDIVNEVAAVMRVEGEE